MGGAAAEEAARMTALKSVVPAAAVLLLCLVASALGQNSSTLICAGAQGAQATSAEDRFDLKSQDGCNAQYEGCQLLVTSPWQQPKISAPAST